MTQTPGRLLRVQAEDSPYHPAPTDRDRSRYAYIVDAARRMFIEHGRRTLTLAQIAIGVKLAPATLRRHICDIDHLFGLILATHLAGIIRILCDIPNDTPNLAAVRRRLYFDATRGLCGVQTPIHFLLLRDRFHLPPDELDPLEHQRLTLAALLMPDAASLAPEDLLALLDSPTLTHPRIEAALATMAALPEPAHTPLSPERTAEIARPDPARPQNHFSTYEEFRPILEAEAARLEAARLGTARPDPPDVAGPDAPDCLRSLDLAPTRPANPQPAYRPAPAAQLPNPVPANPRHPLAAVWPDPDDAPPPRPPGLAGLTDTDLQDTALTAATAALYPQAAARHAAPA